MGYSLGYGIGYDKIVNVEVITNPISNVWILTPEGILNPYKEYVWFDANPPGEWRDDYIWTEKQ